MTTSRSSAGAPRIGVRLGGAEISAEAFLRAARSLKDLLSGVDRSLSGTPRLEWRVAALRGGSAEIAFRPAARTRSPEDYAETVMATALAGFDALAREEERPPHFDGAALHKAAALASCGADPVSVFAEGGPNARRVGVTLTGSSCTATGSVEGTLEALTIHDQDAFTVYDSIDGHRIECRCDAAIPRRAVELIGKRVMASGEVRYEGDTPTSVEVTELTPLGAGTPLDPADLRGLLADDPIDIAEWSRYVREKW